MRRINTAQQEQIQQHPECYDTKLAQPKDIHPQQNEGVFLSEVSQIHHARGTIQIGHEAVRYTVATSESLNPLNSISGALIVPGFGGFKRSSRGLGDALAESGCPTIRFEPLRRDPENRSNDVLRPQVVHRETIGAILSDVRKNPDVKKLPGGKRLKFEHIGLVPHSMGGFAATEFADGHRSRVGLIAYLAAAGFGHPTIAELRTSVPKGLGWSLKNEALAFGLHRNPLEGARILGKIAKYYTANPQRSAGEAYSCLSQDVRPIVARLDEQGVKTSYTAFQKDLLVRPDELIAEYVDSYAVLDNMGHFAPQVHPRDIARHILRIHS